MGRHELKEGRYRIAVGWDRPLSTFFGIVTSGPRDHVHLWVGASSREVLSIDALAAALAPYHALSIEMRTRLYQDRVDALDTGPTDLQRTLSKIVDPSLNHRPEE